MTTIKLATQINAPIQVVLDLNKNIDIDKISTSKSDETAIAGVNTSLINRGETGTWQEKQSGVYLIHKSIISEMEFPFYFWKKWQKVALRNFDTNMGLFKKVRLIL